MNASACEGRKGGTQTIDRPELYTPCPNADIGVGSSLSRRASPTLRGEAVHTPEGWLLAVASLRPP